MKAIDLIHRAEGHYDPAEIGRLKAAIDLATEAHRGQKRKSGEAYIMHPLSVAGLLIDWRLDIDSVIAGVLHDTVEDTSVTLPQLEEQFGEDVAFLVDGVTKISQVRSGMKDISQYRPETSENLSKFLIAIGQDLRVIIIKLADRLHNLQTLNHLPREKQIKIAHESLDVFAPLADRMGMGTLRVQIEDLSFSYLEPEEYTNLQAQLKKRFRQASKNIKHVHATVEGALHQAGVEAEIRWRLKSIYSLSKKLKKIGNLDEIYDLFGLRILVDTVEQCYQVLGILHGLYQPLPTRIKDYISVPKPNGYQSLHTTVITPEGQVVEFQIRTDEMHAHAERGLAAGFHYNEQKLTKNYVRGEVVNKLPRNMQWVATLQEAIASLDGDSTAYDRLKVDLFADRIFTYSPKGDIYDLPEGATALDFAFAVHSDLGLHAHTLRVNNKIATFDKVLQNGDIVEVVTRRKARPHLDWVEFLRTDKARNKVRSYLHNDTRP